MRPPVSIVLAACNGAAYIEAQLQSILDQMEEQDELIVSIDPSSDSTLSIVQSLSKKYPLHDIRILEGPGTGVISNFEFLLSKAAKPVVFLADQDDVWKPDKLDIVCEFFQDPQVMAVVHDATICDEHLNVTEPSYYQFHGSKNGYTANLIRNSFVGACLAVREEVVQSLLPFPRPIPMHDQLLGLQAIRMGKVLFIEDNLLLYRRHGSNQTSLQSSSLADQIEWRIQMMRALKKRKPLNND